MDKKNFEKTLPLTIIVTAYNKEEVIQNCINSLVKQTASKDTFQVVFVDNKSTDATAWEISQHIRHMSNAKLVYEEDQGLSHARNRGILESQGNNSDYVAFIDDDAIAASDWVEKVLQIIDMHNPDIIAGPIYPYYTSPKPEWFLDKYEIREHQKQTGWIDPQNRNFISGSNFVIKRDLLESYGNFDTELGMKGGKLAYAEEKHIYYRALDDGKKAYYDLDLKIQHHVPEFKMNLAYFLYKAYKTGKDELALEESAGGNTLQERPLENFPQFVDGAISALEEPLKKRDKSLYPYVENYIIEVVAPKFFSLGNYNQKLLENNKVQPTKNHNGGSRLGKIAKKIYNKIS